MQRRLFAIFALLLTTASAHAIEAINKQVVVDFLNDRRGAYLAGNPAPLIESAAPDITVTMISSVVEGPAGTRQMRLPQYAPFLKESFANTEYMAYQFKGVKAQIADDGQSAKVFADVEEKARIQGLPVTASKSLIFTLVLDKGKVTVASLTEKIENVQAGASFTPAQPSAAESSSGSGQSSVKIGQ